MKKKMIVSALSVALATSILAVPNINIYAQAGQVQQVQNTVFKDLSPTHWATKDILWAYEKGMVKGYEDGTFRKDLNITEAEFISILYNYSTNTNKNIQKQQGKHWATSYYEELANLGLETKGTNSNQAKDAVLTRGDIAKIIAHRFSFNLDEKQAIYMMYENEISNGLIEGQKTYESYGADKPVKREMISSFIRRIIEKDKITYKGIQSKVRPDEIGGITGIAKDNTPVDFNDFNKTGTTNFDWAKPIAGHYGAKIDGGKEGFIVANSDNTSRVIFSLNSDGSFRSASIHDYNNNKELGREILLASGMLGDKTKVDKIIAGIDKTIATKGKEDEFDLGNGETLAVGGSPVMGMSIRILK